MVVLAVVPQSGWCADTKVVTPKELWALFPTKALPLYPYDARRARVTGSGIFRMYIEPDGRVSAVGVMKSTGNKELDLAAAGGLYRWKAFPGKRREVDMPVTFSMSR
ncbi:MAG TPA: TonB family protein [Chthoniobacterales bacterium]|nr:TonB family protein [Chthoniobacterales bacterium]